MGRQGTHDGNVNVPDGSGVILCIFGSRTVRNYYKYAPKITEAIRRRGWLNIEEVVSGCAQGADWIGEDWAAENDLPVTRFRADWQAYGPSAGPIRNAHMAAYCDCAVGLYDGKSRGAANMIMTMELVGKPCVVIDASEELEEEEANAAVQ